MLKILRDWCHSLNEKAHGFSLQELSHDVPGVQSILVGRREFSGCGPLRFRGFRLVDLRGLHDAIVRPEGISDLAKMPVHLLQDETSTKFYLRKIYCMYVV